MFRKSHTPVATELLDDGDKWLVLGHFDTLNVSCLPNGDPYPLRNTILADVKQNAEKAIASKNDFYCHSIYLIPSEHASQKHRDFWAENTKPVMFITRIHLKSDNSRGGNVCTADNNVDLMIQQVLENFPREDYIYGKTLELTDLILITRSDSANILLNNIEKLSLYPTVGDVYSYCCIASWVFRGTTPLNATNVSTTDQIALVSMRFSMRDAEYAMYLSRYWKSALAPELKNSSNLHFVTGTEDINIVLSNISTSDLVSFYRENIIGHEQTVWTAFDDMTTRLGIALQDEQSDNKYNIFAEHVTVHPQGSCNLSSLQKSYVALQNRLQIFVKRPSTQDMDWLPALCHIVNTLTSSSGDYVLDQLCYILLDGLQGLVEKLETHAGTLNQYRLEIYTVVTSIVYLEEHIIRMEGQLLRRPETRPRVFNMPASILELNLMVMHCFADYFQSDDKEGRDFHFLLVPSLCRTITVRNLLYEMKKGNDLAEEKNHLLYVEIPLDACYKPGLIACILAHEIAHFSGDATRLRSERSKAMFFSTAFMMGQLLGVDHNGSCITQLINELIILGKRSGEHTYYMDGLIRSLKQACRSLIHDREFVVNLQSKSLQNFEPAEDIPQRLSLMFRKYEIALDRGDIQLIVDNIEELGMLAKECYADLAMIELLNITAEEYINIVWDCYCDNDRYENKPLQKALLIERISIVLIVYYQEKTKDIFLVKSEAGRLEVYPWLSAYCSHYSGDRDQASVCKATDLVCPEREDTSYFHPFEIIDCLVGYLKRCLQKMSELGSHHMSEHQKIRTLYQTISEESFLTAPPSQMLLEYRDTLLNKLSTS